MSSIRGGDLLKGAFDLSAYALRNKQPNVSEELPDVGELYNALDEINGVNRETPEILKTADEVKIEEAISSSEQTGKACIPCSNDHLSTCSGLLAEALRFARKDGVESEEVQGRVGLCRDELNAMERVDLRPEVTMGLPPWEKDIANNALMGSRGIRHKMDEMVNVDDLENLAGTAQDLRKDIGVKWVKGKIANLNPEERERVKQKAKEIVDSQLEVNNA